MVLDLQIWVLRKIRAQCPENVDEILYCNSGFLIRFWFAGGKLRVHFTKLHEDVDNYRKNIYFKIYLKSYTVLVLLYHNYTSRLEKIKTTLLLSFCMGKLHLFKNLYHKTTLILSFHFTKLTY